MARVVLCTELGPPETLSVVDQADRPCGAEQVRIEVGAAGINFVDALFVAGTYQIQVPPPFIPGSECAGCITEVGEAVSEWSIGDRVIANLGLGAYSSSVLAHQSQLTALPETVSVAVGATCGQPYSTAWFALTRRSRCKPSHTVAVFGAGSGVGLAACDVAHTLGAEVIAVASDHERLECATDRGALHTINSSTEDVNARLKELAPGGLDLVVDPVGGSLSEVGLRRLGFDGELLVIGFASGTIPTLPTNLVLLRNRRITGVDWGKWAMDHPDQQRQLFDEVLERIVDGDLNPIEPTHYRLEEAGAALIAATTRGVVGRLCLSPSGSPASSGPSAQALS